MLRKTGYAIVLLFTVSATGCLGGAPTSDPTPQQNPAPVDPTGSTNTSNPTGTTNPGTGPAGAQDPTGSATASSDPNNSFEHDTDTSSDPFEVLGRIQEQGPPEVSSRMHSCQKLKYATLGNVLQSLGVTIPATVGTGAAALTGGALYVGGAGALGAPIYGARIPESVEITTAGATKLFDIFVQSAPSIVTAMPNLARCKTAGVAASMFDAQGKCTLEGITCLQGAPAMQSQKDLCDQALTEASTPQIGQTIAVASILAAAHTCE